MKEYRMMETKYLYGWPQRVLSNEISSGLVRNLPHTEQWGLLLVGIRHHATKSANYLAVWKYRVIHMRLAASPVCLWLNFEQRGYSGKENFQLDTAEYWVICRPKKKICTFISAHVEHRLIITSLSSDIVSSLSCYSVKICAEKSTVSWPKWVDILTVYCVIINFHLLKTLGRFPRYLLTFNLLFYVTLFSNYVKVYSSGRYMYWSSSKRLYNLVS